FVFFKQKTAYEIFTTGVQTCALPILRDGLPVADRERPVDVGAHCVGFVDKSRAVDGLESAARRGAQAADAGQFRRLDHLARDLRSEERRVGKERSDGRESEA